MAIRRKLAKDIAVDPEADYTAETHAIFERELKKSVGKGPTVTVNSIAARRGTAQVGIWTGKGKGLTICIHGESLWQVIHTLTAIAEEGHA